MVSRRQLRKQRNLIVQPFRHQIVQQIHGLITLSIQNKCFPKTHQKDNKLTNLDIQLLSAGSGHASGKALGALAKSGASLPIIKGVATTIETAFDTAIDVINGNKVTKETVGCAFAINAAFNLPVGKLGKGTKYSHLSDQEIADKFVENLPDISTRKTTKNFQSGGGYNQALEDFNSLELRNITSNSTPKFGSGMVGTMPDGTKVVLRQGSTSQLGVTIEFQFPQSNTGGVKYEVRYGE